MFSSSSQMTLQSNADLRLFNGLVAVSCFLTSLSRKLAVRPLIFWPNEPKPFAVKFQTFNLKVGLL